MAKTETVQIRILSAKAHARGWVTGKAVLDGVCPPDCPVKGGEKFGIAGSLGEPPNPGDIVKAQGEWSNDPKWGLQLKCTAMVAVLGATEQGLAAFLERLPQFGRVRARDAIRLLGRVGVLAALESEDGARLTAIGGIDAERAKAAADAFKLERGLLDSFTFLSNLGLEDAIVALALEEWKAGAQREVVRDPYVLMDLRGVTFKEADRVARSKMGLAEDDPRRVRAGARVALDEASNEGHVWSTLADLVGGRTGERVTKLTGLTRDQLSAGVNLACESGLAVVDLDLSTGDYTSARECIYAAEDWEAENYLARELARLRSKVLDVVPIGDACWAGRTPDASQVEAVKLCLGPTAASFLTGGPGCIDGQTVLPFESDARRGKGARYYTVEDAFYKFHGIERPGAGRGRNRYWPVTTTVRTLSMLEDSGVGYNAVENIVFSGVKEVWEVCSARGRRLLVTSDHKFKVPSGTEGADHEGYKALLWIDVGDRVICRRDESTSPEAAGRNKTHRPETHAPAHPKARLKRVTTVGKTYTYALVRDARLALEAAMNGLPIEDFVARLQSEETAKGLRFLPLDCEIHHRDERPSNDTLSNLFAMTKADHAREHGQKNRLHFGNQRTEEDTIVVKRRVGERPTYDLQMRGPQHNFVAGGFVVHNCGKTATTLAVLNALRARGLSVLLAAPTGAAAQRMKEATKYPAATEHRVIGWNPVDGGFVHDQGDPLDCDVFILDEQSMSDQALMGAAVGALRTGARVIFVGDKDQLPPVGSGQPFSDLVDSGLLPAARLTHIWRQASQSIIPYKCRAINEGEQLDLSDGAGFAFSEIGNPSELADVVVELVRDKLIGDFDPNTIAWDDIQVIAPQKGGDVGIESLNRRLQAALNPGDPASGLFIGAQYKARAGDRVIHTKNNYQVTGFFRPGHALTSAEYEPTEDFDDDSAGVAPTGVFNGEVGKILVCDFRGLSEDELLEAGATRGVGYTRSKGSLTDKVAIVEYTDRRVLYSKIDIRELQLGYAITTHRSQGRSIPYVFYIGHSSHGYMLDRANTYTGFSRAATFLHVLGESVALQKAVASTWRKERRTSIVRRVREADAELLAKATQRASVDTQVSQQRELRLAASVGTDADVVQRLLDATPAWRLPELTAAQVDEIGTCLPTGAAHRFQCEDESDSTIMPVTCLDCGDDAPNKLRRQMVSTAIATAAKGQPVDPAEVLRAASQVCAIIDDEGFFHGVPEADKTKYRAERAAGSAPDTSRPLINDDEIPF